MNARIVLILVLLTCDSQVARSAAQSDGFTILLSSCTRGRLESCG